MMEDDLVVQMVLDPLLILDVTNLVYTLDMPTFLNFDDKTVIQHFPIWEYL